MLCLALAVLYALLLYYKNKKEDFSKLQKIVLFASRTIAVTLIAFFLLNPLIKSLTRQTEKPIIIFAQDNSASLVAIPDSTFYREAYPESVELLLNRLEDQYDVQSFSFGENVRQELPFSYSDKVTDISELFRYAQNAFYNRHVGAMILASDGLYNVGVHPLYAMRYINYPVYTIALGDTTVYKDAILERINFNRIVFLNNNYPVEVLVNARKAKGEQTNLKIYINDHLKETQTITIDDDNYSQSFRFVFEAQETGQHKITAKLSPLQGEMNTANNEATAYFDVVDSHHKVLLLYSAPHPDVAAIKNAIENNINYELEHYQADDFTKPLEDYSLIILHSLPSVNMPANELFRKIENSQVSLLYILGSQSHIPLFNQKRTGLVIRGSRTSITEALPYYNRDFQFFTLEESTLNTLQRMPPLYAPFGEYQLSPAASVLLYQRIGAITTEQPLIFFNEADGRKIGVITGENLWRWRFRDYALNENQNATNEIIQKIVQYLAITVEKKYFNVSSQDIFFENENIIFDAEVYNKSFELINTPDVYMSIEDSEGTSFNYTFSKTYQAYKLDAGRLPVGDYIYEAHVNVGHEIFKETGAFTVAALNIEYSNTVADHRLMSNIAQTRNAFMFYPDELDNLYQSILDNHDIKPVIYHKMDFTDMLNLPWLLFLIVALLSLEWFVRKWSGTY